MRKPSDQRGVTAIFVAVCAIVLLGSTGVGLDVSSLAFQRSRVQHSVDASALAIAQDCVKNDATKCTTSYAENTTGQHYSTENAAGGSASVPGGVNLSSTQVTVDGIKSVDLFLMGVLGFSSSDVHATATAQWTKHVKKANVIPYFVSLCEYARNRDTNTDVWLRTDVNTSLKGIKGGGSKPDKESILGPGAKNLNLLETCARPSYIPADKVPQPTLNILKGGLWISKNEGSSQVCNDKIYLSVFESPPAATGKLFNCVDKWGQDIDDAGNELLLAIYAPVGDTTYDAAYGGVAATPYAQFGPPGNALLTSGPDGGVGGAFKTKIVGFAPFHVTGYCLDGTKRCRGSGATADTLYGHFTNSSKLFDSLDQYSETGTTDLGATKIEMIN